MYNSKSNLKCLKKRFNKCNTVCRLYSPIQSAFAKLLEEDDTVKNFECNVPLTDFPLGENYTSDFLITKSNGDYAVRECVFRAKLSLPKTAQRLDASRIYWLRKGIYDWGIIINAEE